MTIISKRRYPGKLEYVLHKHGRAYLVEMRHVASAFGPDPLIFPLHRSVLCPEGGDPREALVAVVNVEMREHFCLSYNEVKTGLYHKPSYPKFLREIIDLGLSNHDELWLSASKSDTALGLNRIMNPRTIKG
ncbi:hypothetical protein LCGC14_0510590 [marine sediment metagenome]|jgi:hypothetical protein|uniref:Uncharacterized protein n=1 Tax=marine sediment metagenome TaxID=412755 RepID=A0A0F9S1E4_9ZZZZ